MYIDYFNAIQTLIKSNLNTIKTVDFFNRQYERYSETKAVAFPAIYVEFDSPLTWQDSGNKSQLAETEIKLHIVACSIEDTLDTVMSTAQEVHRCLHSRSLVYQENKLSTGMSRRQSELITSYDQLKVIILTYHTTLFDNSTVKIYSKVRVTPRVS